MGDTQRLPNRLVLHPGMLDETETLQYISDQRSRSFNLVQLLGSGLTKATATALLELFAERQAFCPEEPPLESLEVADCVNDHHLHSLLKYTFNHKLFRRLILRSTLANEDIIGNLPPIDCIHEKLEALTISGQFFLVGQALQLRQALETTTRLVDLTMRSNTFERFAVCQVAEGIARNRSVKTLTYNWKESIEACVILHAATARHHSIRYLHLSGDCTPGRLCDFIATDICQPLETLTLNGMGLMDLGQLIWQFSPMSQALQRLDLSDNSLHNYQLDHLFGCLINFPLLTTLDLSRNSLSDFAAVMLTGEHVISNSLTILTLSGNQFNDEAADELLSRLWKFPLLETFDLSNNRLTKLAFRRFLSVPNCHRLKYLHLFHARFSWLDLGEQHTVWVRRLLNRTPLKIGTFWACSNVRLKHRLDTRKFSVMNAENAPASLWPLVLEMANEWCLESEESRAASIIYAIIRGEAMPMLTAFHNRPQCAALRHEEQPQNSVMVVAESKVEDDFATDATGGISSEFLTVTSSAFETLEGLAGISDDRSIRRPVSFPTLRRFVKLLRSRRQGRESRRSSSS